jgi:hypothetical protein
MHAKMATATSASWRLMEPVPTGSVQLPVEAERYSIIMRQSVGGNNAVTKKLPSIRVATYTTILRLFLRPTTTPRYCGGTQKHPAISQCTVATLPYVIHHSDCDKHAVNKQLSCVRVLFVCGLCARRFAVHHNIAIVVDTQTHVHKDRKRTLPYVLRIVTTGQQLKMRLQCPDLLAL